MARSRFPTAQQRAFAYYRLEHPNAPDWECYVAAGYSKIAKDGTPKTRRQLDKAASSVSNATLVVRLLEKLEAELSDKVTTMVAKKDFKTAMTQLEIRRGIEILAHATTHKVKAVGPEFEFIEREVDTLEPQQERAFQTVTMTALKELVAIEGMVTSKVEHSFDDGTWLRLIGESLASLRNPNGELVLTREQAAWVGDDVVERAKKLLATGKTTSKA